MSEAPAAFSYAAFCEYARLSGIDLPEAQMRELHKGVLLLQPWLAYLRADDSSRFVVPRREHR